jgi:hypothetical protein
MRTRTLVRETRDAGLTKYVVENLGKGVPPGSVYFKEIQDTRQQLREDLVGNLWSPLAPSWIRTRVMVRDPKHQLKVQERITPFLLQQKQSPQKSREIDNKKFLQQQFDAFQKEQTELLQSLIRDLSREDLPDIAKKFKDPQPMVRWLAIQVAAKYWLPLEKEIIELLTDRDPAVKAAAHQALVRLSRGTDLGPSANPAPVQITKAQEAWRHWLDRQAPPPESRLHAHS